MLYPSFYIVYWVRKDDPQRQSDNPYKKGNQCFSYVKFEVTNILIVREWFFSFSTGYRRSMLCKPSSAISNWNCFNYLEYLMTCTLILGDWFVSFLYWLSTKYVFQVISAVYNETATEGVYEENNTLYANTALLSLSLGPPQTEDISSKKCWPKFWTF